MKMVSFSRFSLLWLFYFKSKFLKLLLESIGTPIMFTSVHFLISINKSWWVPDAVKICVVSTDFHKIMRGEHSQN